MPATEVFSNAAQDTGEYSIRENNPFSLPNAGQFLAYYHYLNGTKLSQELKKVSRKKLCGYSPDEKAKAIEAQKEDVNANLIREINKKRSGSSFSKLRYMQNIRSLCKMRVLLGKKRDGCILLDQKLDIEHKKYLEIKHQYKECVIALEQFLAYDHRESMCALSEASAEITRTLELTARRDDLSHRCGKIQLEVYQWEEAWRTVKDCYRFLCRVSPLDLPDPASDFNSEDNFQISRADKLTSSEPMNESRKTTHELVRVTSLESLIATFEKKASDLANSQFKTPMDLGLFEAEDILRAFREIESQNHNALIHLESLDGPMTEMIARMDVAEESVKREIDNVLGDIQYLECEIDREEKRVEMLEKQCNSLIGEKFRGLVISQPALQLRILIEDAYESCVAKNDSGLEPLGMAEAIENMYERLNNELDSLPKHLVRECEREGFREGIRETREAEEAAFKFELMHRLLIAVKRLMEPTEPKYRPLMKRSMWKKKKTKKPKTMVSEGEMPSASFFKKDCKLQEYKHNDNSNVENEEDRKH